MRALLQRVTSAQVTVEGRLTGRIERGFLVLAGITHGDTEPIVERMAAKIANLRVFEDDGGHMNRSLLDLLAAEPTSAGVLLVSQFTLYADSRKGRRPSFTDAAHPDLAQPLLEHLSQALGALGIPVQHGEFGAHMAVSLVNDGPVTIWLDSAEL